MKKLKYFKNFSDMLFESTDNSEKIYIITEKQLEDLDIDKDVKKQIKDASAVESKDKLGKKIEGSIVSTLVVSNKQSIFRAVDKILKIFNL